MKEGSEETHHQQNFHKVIIIINIILVIIITSATNEYLKYVQAIMSCTRRCGRNAASAKTSH